MKGYEHANALAMELWESVYPNALLLALTDTFSTKAFFQVRDSAFHPSTTPVTTARSPLLYAHHILSGPV